MMADDENEEEDEDETESQRKSNKVRYAKRLL